MKRSLILVLALASGGPALAAGAPKPNMEAGQNDPLHHPGFEALKWGAPLGAVFQVYPELKKKYAAAAAKAVKAGQVVIMDGHAKFKDQDWPAKFYVDADGLHRVVLTRELARTEQGAADVDKFLDPLFGGLEAPEKTPDGVRLWKGGDTVISVTTTRLPGADRVEIAFEQPSAHKDAAEGSLGIE